MPSQSSTEPDVLQTGFGPGGKEISVDDPLCLAKTTQDQCTKITRHWLKRATNGVNAGKLYNPHWPLFDTRTNYVFCKASEEAFRAYLRFLETDNTLFLMRAERSL